MVPSIILCDSINFFDYARNSICMTVFLIRSKKSPTWGDGTSQCKLQILNGILLELAESTVLFFL